MFSGIIEGTGTLKTIARRDDHLRLEIQAGFDLADAKIGDSLAVNGVCLTITSRLGNTIWTDVSEQTVRVTTLGRLQPGSAVNLEQALRYGGRVGGHLVQGHVDAMARVAELIEHAGSRELIIDVPVPLTKYMVERGSIAVDGVSLTIARCWGSFIAIFVIPHTDVVTTFHRLNTGDFVNLEVDLVGKYVEKLAFLPSESYHADEAVRLAWPANGVGRGAIGAAQAAKRPSSERGPTGNS